MADIQSTNKVDKDNDPSSDTDDETQTHHSISKGGVYEYCFVMKVLFTYTCIAPDHVPDNIYTGRIYYERIGSNKWLMIFMVVQKIKVFLEVINMVSSLT